MATLQQIETALRNADAAGDTEAALMSYWMANEKQINKLKSDYIDLFTKVRDAFSDKKAKLKKEKVSE